MATGSKGKLIGLYHTHEKRGTIYDQNILSTLKNINLYNSVRRVLTKKRNFALGQHLILLDDGQLETQESSYISILGIAVPQTIARYCFKFNHEHQFMSSPNDQPNNVIRLIKFIANGSQKTMDVFLKNCAPKGDELADWLEQATNLVVDLHERYNKMSKREQRVLSNFRIQIRNLRNDREEEQDSSEESSDDESEDSEKEEDENRKKKTSRSRSLSIEKRKTPAKKLRKISHDVETEESNRKYKNKMTDKKREKEEDDVVSITDKISDPELSEDSSSSSEVDEFFPVFEEEEPVEFDASSNMTSPKSLIVNTTGANYMGFGLNPKTLQHTKKGNPNNTFFKPGIKGFFTLVQAKSKEWKKDDDKTGKLVQWLFSNFYTSHQFYTNLITAVILHGISIEKIGFPATVGADDKDGYDEVHKQLLKEFRRYLNVISSDENALSAVCNQVISGMTKIKKRKRELRKKEKEVEKGKKVMIQKRKEKK